MSGIVLLLLSAGWFKFSFGYIIGVGGFVKLFKLKYEGLLRYGKIAKGKGKSLADS